MIMITITEPVAIVLLAQPSGLVIPSCLADKGSYLRLNLTF